MGGPWQIRHRPIPGVAPETVAAAAESALRLVDQQMSPYRPDSDLMRVNQAPVGQFVAVPPEMLPPLHCALHWARLSGGAINIGLGQVVNVWGFGPDPAPATRPDAQNTGDLAAQAGLGAFVVRDDPPAVLRRAPVSLDLCALAKGFAVDLAGQAVQALGVSDFLIEAAGEVLAKGNGRDNQPWKIGLELPVPSEHHVIYDEVDLVGASATSGSYRKFHDIDGTRVCHCIDPKTGAPLDADLLSVTVFHDSCMVADALCTVLYVLGPDQGPVFARKHGLSTIFMSKTPSGLKQERTLPV